jgi:exopolyphosphatase/guanosine-5'-triphosphate,3'-diphosphate pyrophosphatase
VADALDRSHLQIIDDFNVKVADDKVIITPHTTSVYEYEKIAMTQKGNLFDSVFGLEVMLQ